jgi:ABC-type transport system substrate-binding protein
MEKRPRLRFLAAALAAAVGIPAVAIGALSAAAAASKSPSRGGPTVVVAEPTAPSTFDPQASALNNDWKYWGLTYQCLLSVSKSGQIQPELAKSYQVSRNGLQYTFTLRPRVRFQNGELLTSADVVYTFDRLLSTGLPYFKSRFAALKSVAALGPSRVRFTLSQPAGGFLLEMADPFAAGCAILSKQAAQSGTNLALKMVGTGPYAMSSYALNSKLVYTRFERYWGPKPKVQKIVVDFMPSETSQLTALQSGQINVMFPSATLPELRANRAVRIWSVPSANCLELNFNTLGLNGNGSTPLASLAVRRAIALALDRKQIASLALGGTAVPASYFPKALPWAPPLSSMPYQTTDLKLARRLMAQAGYANGFTLHYMYIAGYASWVDNFAQVLKNELAAIKINVVIDPLSTPVWLNDLTKATYDLSFNVYPFFADPYLYVWIRPGRSGPTPAAITAAENKALAARTLRQYQGATVAIARLEAKLVFGALPLDDFTEYVATRGLAHVSPSFDGSLGFLGNVTAS